MVATLWKERTDGDVKVRNRVGKMKYACLGTYSIYKPEKKNGPMLHTY